MPAKKVDIEQEKRERVKKWFKESPQGPVMCKFLLTYRCNLNCKFCKFSVYNKGDRNEISSDKWIKTVKELADLDCERIHLEGGEPLVKGKIIKIMQEIKEKSIKGSITTNGTLLRQKVAKKAVDIGWDSIQVSLDSPRAKIHDYYRGMEGSFKKTVKALENLKKYRDDRKKDPDVTVASVLTSWNVEDIPEMIELVNEFNVDFYRLIPISTDLPVVKKYTVNSFEKLKNQLKKAEQIARDLSINNNFNEIIRDMNLIDKDNKYKERKNKSEESAKPICFEPWWALSINPTGGVTLCSSEREDEKILSLKNKELREIWFSKDFNEVRRKVRNRKDLKKCKDCCFAVYSENKDIYEDLSDSITNQI